MVAGDVYRPAAITQLEVIGERNWTCQSFHGQ